MSLVNDMLRDLEQRESKSPPANRSAAGSHDSSPGSSFRYGFISFALVLAVCVIAVWLWQGQNSTQKVATASVSDSRVPSQTKLAVSSSVASSSASVSEIAATPAMVWDDELLNAPPSVSALEENLIKGKAALLADQLTRPVDASAYLFYQKALSLAPQSPEALAGLQAIADRYAALAQRQLERDNLDSTRRLLEKADGVWPGRESVTAIREQLAKREPAPAQARRLSSQEQRPRASKSTPAPSRDAVTQTLASRDTAAVSEARALIARGTTLEAEKQLKIFLQRQHQQGLWPTQARRTLLELYLSQERLPQARGLLASELPAEQSAYLQAKIANHKGDYEAAIGHLESALDDVEASDEAYRALMASLYQRLEQSASAQVYYTRLLQAFGSKARYWLGLGVAMDRQGDYPGATNAYRRAQSAADTNTTIQNFTRQRLAQLNQ